MPNFEDMLSAVRTDCDTSTLATASEIRRVADRRNSVQHTVLAVIVLVVIAGATTGVVAVRGAASHHHATPQQTVSTVVPSISADPSPTPSQPAPSDPPTHSSTASPGYTGGSVPPGFIATDMTFVSGQEGWLLGTAPCSSAPCTSIVRTTDGGATWVGIHAPRVPLKPNADASCDAPCANGLRFANPHVGYAYGPNSFYVTKNGGESWSKAAGGAFGLEVGNGTALRVAPRAPGCPPGCLFTFSWAPLGSVDFRPSTITNGATQIIGVNAQLLRSGHAAYALVFNNVAGGEANAHAALLTSNDDGKTWTVRDDPCGTVNGNEYDASKMAVGGDGSFSLLCLPRMGGSAYVVTSTNHGATFGTRHKGPAGVAETIGAANAKTLLIQVYGQTDASLYRTTNGGVSWHKVASAPEGAAEVGSPIIGFENTEVGRWVPVGHQMLTTTDGGRIWKRSVFPD